MPAPNSRIPGLQVRKMPRSEDMTEANWSQEVSVQQPVL